MFYSKNKIIVLTIIHNNEEIRKSAFIDTPFFSQTPIRNEQLYLAERHYTVGSSIRQSPSVQPNEAVNHSNWLSLNAMEHFDWRDYESG